MDALERIDKADDQWTAAEETAAKLKADLFDAFAQAVREGHTPDAIAARQRSRKTTEQIDAGLSFSGAYIRRVVRKIGAPALRTGPKSKQPAGE